MAFLGTFQIDDYLGIPAATHQFSSGAALAPTVLTYSIYEEATDTGLDEDVDMVVASPFDSVVGCYWVRRQLTTAAGFEAGKNYMVLIKATVDSVSAIQMHTFQVEAAVALQASVDDLEGRLTAVRAGYLDNLTNLDAAVSLAIGAGTPIHYAPTAAARTVGSDQGGAFGDLASHDDVYYITGEVNSGTLLEVLVTRATSTVAEIPSLVRITGYYQGNAGHYVSIQAYNYVTAAFQTIGTMLLRTTSFAYTGPLGSDFQSLVNGEMLLKFLHSPPGTGITNHRLWLDWISWEKVDASASSLAADIAAIRQQTDQMGFSFGDLKATLDSELVGLSDDAITASKYDEATAYPVAAVDSGATRIARVGADSDTLETLSDQIDLQATATALTTAQADLDNPTQYMANVSALATTAALSTHDGKLVTAAANVVLALADTGELQADWADGGRLDLLIDAILADTASLNDTVLAEITAATDVPATPTARQALMLLYMMARNNSQATATERRVLNNAGTEILDATMSDDGTTFSAGQLGDA